MFPTATSSARQVVVRARRDRSTVPSAVGVVAGALHNDHDSFGCAWPRFERQFCTTAVAVLLVASLAWYLQQIDHFATSIALPASLLQIYTVLKDPNLLADGVGCDMLEEEGEDDEEDSATESSDDDSRRSNIAPEEVHRRRDAINDDDMTWDMNADESHTLVLQEMREVFLQSYR